MTPAEQEQLAARLMGNYMQFAVWCEGQVAAGRMTARLFRELMEEKHRCFIKAIRTEQFNPQLRQGLLAYAEYHRRERDEKAARQRGISIIFGPT